MSIKKFLTNNGSGPWEQYPVNLPTKKGTLKGIIISAKEFTQDRHQLIMLVSGEDGKAHSVCMSSNEDNPDWDNIKKYSIQSL